MTEIATPRPADRLDEAGWKAALDAVKGDWGALTDDATSISFVADATAQDVSGLAIVSARVELDGKSLTLGGESRHAIVVVAPGRHTLAFEVTVGGPPCVYCSMYVLRLSRKNVALDVEARTSALVRIGVRAPGSITTPLEERIQLVVDMRAWRRSSAENVGALARDAADRCIERTTRDVESDRAEKDLVRLLCHQDKRHSCELALSAIAEHAERLLEARARADALEVSHEVGVLAALQRKATEAAQEATRCIGFRG